MPVVTTAGHPTDASSSVGGAIETGTGGLSATDGTSFRATLSFGEIASEADSRVVSLRQRKRTPKHDFSSQNDGAKQPVPPAVPKTKGILYGFP